jgi:anti-sigma regulatory factor (Ser/Thr protein kinase)
MTNRIQISATRDLAEIKRVSTLVEEFGQSNGLPSRMIFHVNLALDELITNLITYGYPDREPGDGDIRIDLVLDAGALTTQLRDDGFAFNPLEAPPPDLDLPVEEKPIGGLGIHFVLTVMDDVQYRYEDGFNHLTMRQNVTDGANVGGANHDN